MKNNVWRVLLFTFMLFVISACSTNGGDKDTGGDTGSTSSSSSTNNSNAAVEAPVKENEPAEPVELTIMAGSESWDPDNAYLSAIQDATNTKLDFQFVPSSEYQNKRNVVMASGEYPTVMKISHTESVFQKYVDEGLLLPLDEYLEKYPNVRDAFPAEVWEENRNPKDGMIYHIPRITGFYPQTLAYRKDWADQLGIPEPQTLEEFRDMLVAFKEQNPGNVDDVLPLVPNRNDMGWVDPIFSAFGTPFMAWQPSTDNPNRLILVNTLPAFKEALIYLRDLRQDGLLDPEWMVGNARGLFKFYGSQAGSTTDWPQFIDLREEAIKEVDPNGEVQYITGLTGPSGIQGGPLYTPNNQGEGTVLTSAATPEQADAFFRVMDWQYDGEGYEFMRYGVEGITYDIVDGQKVRRGRDAVIDENPRYDLYMIDRVFLWEPPRWFEFNKENFGQIPDEDFEYSKNVLEEVESVKVKNYLVYSDDPVILENMNKIKDAVIEVASKIILDPNSNVDQVFEEYLQKLQEHKIEGVTEAVNRLNSVN